MRGPEEFVNPSNGLLINTASITELTEAIVEMAHTHKKYNSVEIKSEIKARYGSETIRKKLTDFYNSAIND